MNVRPGCYFFPHNKTSFPVLICLKPAMCWPGLDLNESSVQEEDPRKGVFSFQVKILQGQRTYFVVGLKSLTAWALWTHAALPALGYQ